MPGRRKKRISGPVRRKPTATKAVGTWWASLPPAKIKEALDALYATEDSSVDPVMARMQSMTIGSEDW
jgi:hypothetical protein